MFVFLIIFWYNKILHIPPNDYCTLINKKLKGVIHMCQNGKKVVLGMSGGVDSSVSAYLLKEQGYEVIALFMKNWEENDDDGVCTTTDDYEDVRKVCSQLGIKYYTINFVQEYWDKVFTYFLDEYKKFRTPNPDVLCNKEIKFKAFLEYALKLEADYIAMGHYARVDFVDGEYRLLRGLDSNKDQSYFLCGLNQYQLSKTIFPIGELVKSDVRKIAKEQGLATANKKDSTGICFIGERDFNEFLSKFLPAQPGDIVNEKGEKLGKHNGLIYYTFGQRKGLGIGGQGSGEPWFVAEKDVTNNRLIVVQGADNPKLFSKGLLAKDVNWILDYKYDPKIKLTAKLRYRQQDIEVDIEVAGENSYRVAFKEPQKGVTPGQFVVFYNKEVCLGGGVIDEIYK